ncbi:CBS domain-containing protein [Bacillus sp. RG28]|uniref:CBS domain-containing protein n=1 Tax=Gottfriedia endophytica TaxID=2820819 RepID=A0A940NNL9_9BACI|nr:cyclic-di-AMP-binding protein CbpB [Gottfriedia endophytica]MBP0724733.1 CBS domain-containing protein [Gottfriedia endophytica]
MISMDGQHFYEHKVEEVIISSEKVAHVQVGNNLEHALLVLTKSGYSAIPVLNPKFQLKGLISTSMILDRILGLERIEFEKLDSMKVEDVMSTDHPTLKPDDTLAKGLEYVVDHPFVCVVDDNLTFEGILTRRAILKQLKKSVRRYNK